MIPHFPDPYPDELLYSVLARTADIYSMPSYKKFIQFLFGTENAISTVEFPSYLDALVSLIIPGNNFSSDYFIDYHTFFPYYSPFMPNERRAILRENMKGCEGAATHMRAGLMASRLSSFIGFLRFCKSCLADDEKCFDEPYWHRSHQVPGVYMCPTHEEFLYRSDVRIRNRVTRQNFVSLRKSGYDGIRLIEGLDENATKIMLKIAKNVHWLMMNPRISTDLLFLQQRYDELLYDHNLGTKSGRVYLATLVSGLYSKYSEQLLGLLGCNLSESVNENWIARILRKKLTTHNPIRHLLLLDFLNCSPQKLFFCQEQDSPFGSGPWPCLNMASNHYLRPLVNSVTIKYSPYTNNRPIGIFSCQCGFSYGRTGPDKNGKYANEVGKIISYGETWERKLIRLWAEPKKSLRSIAKNMGVDPSTIKKQAVRLGLSFPKPGIGNREINAPVKKIVIENTSPADNLEEYRGKWREALATFKGESVTQIRKKKPSVYIWLYRNDPEWLKKNSPFSVKIKQVSQRVNWSERDAEIVVLCEEGANKLYTNSGKPVQVTVSAIGRSIGKLSLIQKHLDKMPNTKVVLEKIVETDEAYVLRKLRYFYLQVLGEGKLPSKWQVVKLSGVERWLKNEKVSNLINSLFS